MQELCLWIYSLDKKKRNYTLQFTIFVLKLNFFLCKNLRKKANLKYFDVATVLMVRERKFTHFILKIKSILFRECFNTVMGYCRLYDIAFPPLNRPISNL